MIKKIQGYRETYVVNDRGFVYTQQRPYSNGEIKSSHILKTNENSNGYLRVGMNLDGKQKYYFIHRLVAEAFIPNPENKPFVNHKDGNKLNNCVSNLEWCTKSENEKHAHRIGLKSIHTKGEKHGMHKLTQNDVDYIRKVHIRYDAKFGTKALAKKFSVNPQTITNVVNYKNWCVDMER